MQTHMNLKIKATGSTQIRGMEIKSEKRFSAFGKFLKKSVSYYQDEDLKKAGSPFIWTE